MNSSARKKKNQDWNSKWSQEWGEHRKWALRSPLHLVRWLYFASEISSNQSEAGNPVKSKTQYSALFLLVYFTSIIFFLQIIVFMRLKPASCSRKNTATRKKFFPTFIIKKMSNDMVNNILIKKSLDAGQKYHSKEQVQASYRSWANPSLSMLLIKFYWVIAMLTVYILSMATSVPQRQSLIPAIDLMETICPEVTPTVSHTLV